MIKQPSVNRLVQKAKSEVGKDRFSNVEDEFRAYAERELLRMRLQDMINSSWKGAKGLSLRIIDACRNPLRSE